MINADMRWYAYHKLGAYDAYGQPQLLKNQGTVNMAINITSQSTQDNILFKDASYIGLTLDKSIDDKCIIESEYGLLKVLYINSKGRYVQVYMERYE